MPTYEYKCKKCEHGFEIVQKIKDDPLRQCPECKQESLQKIITSGGGFQLKGSGWYKTGGY